MATPLHRHPTAVQQLGHPQVPGVFVEFMLITPEIANRILAEWNNHNRPFRPRAVSAYARDMTTNSFPFNGDTIRRATDGTLLDGQHRLRAVVESGTSQLMLVVTGLPVETQATMDSGIARIFADQLKLDGEKSTAILGALVRKVVLWEAGYLTFDANLKLSHPELAACLADYPELRESADFASVHRTTGLGPSVIAMAHWLLRQVDQESAEWFIGRIHDGANLPAGHPCLLVTKRIRENLSKRVRLSDGEQLALLIAAWNAYRDGRTGQGHLKLATTLTSANFPTPR